MDGEPPVDERPVPREVAALAYGISGLSGIATGLVVGVVVGAVVLAFRGKPARDEDDED